MRKKLQHILLWIVALSILNSSIDVIDTPFVRAGASSAESRYLEIESILELVLDTTLDQTLPDHTGSDQHSLLKKNTSFGFSNYQPKVRLVVTSPAIHAAPRLFATVSGTPLQGFITVFSPPPDFTNVLS